MASYLICWKPDTENKEKGWPEAALIDLFTQLEKTGLAKEPWRFARKQGVKVGERVYLLRQGKKGQAILGYGSIEKLPKSSYDRTTVRFEKLVDPSKNVVLATHLELKDISDGSSVWNTQSSGILLPQQIANELEHLIVGRKPVADTKTKPEPANPDWTRDELILALELYFREPGARGSKTHPECIALSKVLNHLPINHGKEHGSTFRNANGVGMKLSNFLKYDPSYKGKGLSAGSIAEKEVWDTFASDLEKLKITANAILAGAKELADAGLSADNDEDVDEESEEGQILTRIHKIRERNASLVKKKKKKVLNTTGALKCEVCGFDFEKRYGKLGAGFAECHHGRAVSSLKPGEKTKLSELHIVCANCHRMIHRARPWMSVEQLKGL